MSTSYQAAAGPSGRAGLQLASVQPMSGNWEAAPKPVLTRRLEQLPQERLISNQMKKLTVRSLVYSFEPNVNKPPVI